MSPRDTKTGSVLEAMILHGLANGGYSYQSQVTIGKRPGGRKHNVDVVAEREGKRFLISLKWQQVSGTAEQKIPFEVICLAEAVLESSGKITKAYLVLGGEGWTLRDYFMQGGLKKHLEYADSVEILSLEAFVARANQGRL